MPKSIPQRQCVGCREKKPKPELIRVVRAPEGDISLDARGKAAGRGAYLCPDPECLKKARKSRALERAFDAPTPPAFPASSVRFARPAFPTSPTFTAFR